MRLITASECRKIAEDFVKNSPLYERISNELSRAALLGKLEAPINFDSFEDRKEAERILPALGFDILGGCIRYDISEEVIDFEEKEIYTLYISWKK